MSINPATEEHSHRSTDDIVTSTDQLQWPGGDASGVVQSMVEAANNLPGSTWVYTIPSQFNQSSELNLVVALSDGHTRSGLMTFTIFKRSPDGEQWHTHHQDMYTAFPQHDIRPDSEQREEGMPRQNWSDLMVQFNASGGGPPSVFPENPPDRPANHLAELCQKVELNDQSDHPVTALRGFRTGSTVPTQWQVAMAKSLMDALNREITAEGRRHSWRGWPIISVPPSTAIREPSTEGHHEPNGLLNGANGIHLPESESREIP